VARIIHKGELPQPDEVPPCVRALAAAASGIRVRAPRPAGFPLLFGNDMQLIEPAVAFLHEHLIERAHTLDTVRTYAELLLDWFDALEAKDVRWAEADAVDLVAYRNRMLKEPSSRTRRPYSVRTINHRVQCVLRFYEWAERHRWVKDSPLASADANFTVSSAASRVDPRRRERDRSIFVLRQFESLPRPLSGEQVLELLARLQPPYDLIARWQVYTGLRVSEVLRLSMNDVPLSARDDPEPEYRTIEVLCKGRKRGVVIASASLLNDTDHFCAIYRKAWCNRAARRRSMVADDALFINDRGVRVRKNTYQHVLRAGGAACGFKVTSHQLRATFACMMLARLEQLAAQGAAIDPLLIVKILLHHERIETTDRYLRAVAVDTHTLVGILDSLVPEPK